MLLPPSPQLTKDQLLSVLPVLVAHLQSSNYVVYSYAAITIERILFIKQNGQLLYVPSSCATRHASG
jgi:exportin-2 (importin alpha re-exporter)